MLAALVIVSLAAVVVGVDVGSCPTPKVHPDFDLQQFEGKWYEIETTSTLDKAKKKCTSWIVEFRETGKAGFMHKYISVNGKQKTDYSDITSPKKKEMAKLYISPLKGTLLAKKYDLWIIDTDYKNYAIAFTCKTVLFTHQETVQILSRTKSLDDKTRMEIYNILKSRSLSQKNLSDVNQTDKLCDE